MDLRSQQIKNTYGNILTTGTTAGAPLTGTLQNGQGSNVTAITLEGSLTAQQVNSDNLRLDGNTISSQNTNGNILIQPNGTGDVVINESGADVDFRVEGTGEQNALFVDGANGRVGIGTSNPSVKLDVNGTGNTTARIGADGSSETALHFSNTTIGRVSVRSTAPLAFETSATERMRIDADGILVVGNSAAINNNFLLNIQTNSGNGGIVVQPNADTTVPLIRALTASASASVAEIGTASGSALYFSTAATERMRIDSSGNVGIGITPSAWAGGYRAIDNLIYSSSYSNNGGIAGMSFNAYNNGTNWIYKNTTTANRFESTLDSFRWYTAPSGTAGNAITFTERLRLDSDGLKFNGDTAAANALDDYEEGTFTPRIDGQTSAGTGTYSVQVGRYTKIGHRIWVDINLAWSAHTGTGNMLIGNLPETAKNVTEYGAASPVGYANLISLTASNTIMAVIGANHNYIRIWQMPVGGGSMTQVPIDTSAQIVVSVSYEVN